MARNTNPWMKIYTRDWLESESILGMSCHSEGVYFRCIAAQGIRGNLPADLAKLARIINRTLEDVAAAWEEIASHFKTEIVDGEERLFNEKQRFILLESERKSKNYSKAQAKKKRSKSVPNLEQTCTEPDPDLVQIRALRASVSVSASVSDSKKKDKTTKVYSETEVSLGKRFAKIRADLSGMKSVHSKSEDYYTKLVHEILSDGEANAEDLERVANWFATTPEGNRSFRYGVGNLAHDYTNVLRKNIASYMASARGGFTTPPRGMQSYKSRDEDQGVARYADLSNGWLTPNE